MGDEREKIKLNVINSFPLQITIINRWLMNPKSISETKFICSFIESAFSCCV
jgi:hypothetical protein